MPRSNDLKVLGMYCVPCECSKVYVRQTWREDAEHIWDIHLSQPEKCVVAEHSMEAGWIIVASPF